ncbi:MAG: rod shape-determining protein RodA [Deltaproteobacteria bacterium]|nr:rod shape-determining protein RodA [Deltaproteobacteria bacterium]
MIDRRLVEHFDWILLGLTLLLQSIGILTLYSAVNASADVAGLIGPLYMKQASWFGIGAMGMITLVFFNYRWLHRWGGLIYAACVVLLVVVALAGRDISGSRRWLVFGGVSFQPSEMVKIAVPIMLARYFSDRISATGMTLKDLWRPLIWVLIPFGLIVRQPDLGTALIVALIAGSMTLFVKIERRCLLGLGGGSALVAGVGWFFLKAYQKQRIAIFLDPEKDPLGAGYHIIQSKIAVGSGMLTGKGFLKGTQNALSFLPEQHTDFIFSVLAEEWGFLGSALFLVVYFLIVAWGLNIAMRSKEPFGTILAVGITSMMFWQALINIAMALGLLPVVGVTLPLVSYGGSSLVSTLLGIGILLNISMRRFMFKG